VRVTDRDHIDRFLERLASLGHPDIDLEVEAIVDRIGGINRRIKKGMEVTLSEYGLTLPDWQVLSTLRLSRQNLRSSPGDLADDLELSSGAMTSRLDRLEQTGLVRRLPDPEDRRGVVVSLTAAGQAHVDAAMADLLERERAQWHAVDSA